MFHRVVLVWTALGVDSSEQLKLLKKVKKNVDLLTIITDILFIILFNSRRSTKNGWC